MELDFLCFHREVDVLAGSEVEVGGGSSGDIARLLSSAPSRVE